jgi:hypothetical protein
MRLSRYYAALSFVFRLERRENGSIIGFGVVERL